MENINDFKNLLRSNKSVTFTYKKLNGKLREATGTLNKEAIDKFLSYPSGPRISYPENIIKYFDLIEEDWRSFRYENLIKVNE